VILVQAEGRRVHRGHLGIETFRNERSIVGIELIRTARMDVSNEVKCILFVVVFVVLN
jgi:hypothetical protein